MSSPLSATPTNTDSPDDDNVLRALHESLERDAAQPVVHCRLGMLYLKLNRLSEAEGSFRGALAHQPLFPPALGGLRLAATLYQQTNRLSEAEAILRFLTASQPGDFDLANDLAILVQRQGRLDEAETLFKTLLEKHPSSAVGWSNYGGMLLDRNRLAAAEAACRRAVNLAPENSGAYGNLGLALLGRRQFDEAEEACRKALSLAAPGQGLEATNTLGLVLREKHKLAEAETVFRQAIKLWPERLDIHNNLGLTLTEADRLDEAEEVYRQCLKLAPNSATTLINLGALLAAQKRYGEAEDACRRAIAFEPENAAAHYNLALILLRQKRFDEGLPEFEWRMRPGMTSRAAPRPPAYSIPMWQGEPLQGKAILVQTEQAFGDEILFVRYAEALKTLGARKVLLATRAPLVQLMKTLPWVDEVAPLESASELASKADTWAFTLSLPYRTQTKIDALPSRVSYLFPDPDKVRAWQEWLAERAPAGARRVGLLWRGRPYPPGRSQPFDRLLSIVGQCSNAVGVSLQMDMLPEEIEQARTSGGAFPILDAGSRIKDFSDTAALLSLLDLFIAIDSAPAHLAGAMGRPTWTFLRSAPDWRWFLDTDQSPWYPSMRLFRQTAKGDWSAPLAQLARALGKIA